MKINIDGCCLVCEKPLTAFSFGPIVIAEVLDGEPASFAHGQCWVDSGRKVLLPTGSHDGIVDFSWVPESAVDALPERAEEG
jgi:hypothetical protein